MHTVLWIGAAVVAIWLLRKLNSYALVRINKHLPIDIIYYLNGQECFRETTTWHEVEKTNRLGFGLLMAQMVQQGLTWVGSPVERRLPDNVYELSVGVIYQGQHGIFKMVARPPEKEKE